MLFHLSEINIQSLIVDDARLIHANAVPNGLSSKANNELINDELCPMEKILLSDIY